MDFHTGRVKSTEEFLTVWDATPLKRQGEDPTKKRKIRVQSLSRVRLFCNPMDCSPPDSSVHGISQARIWE